jgi:hypothetical protein
MDTTLSVGVTAAPGMTRKTEGAGALGKGKGSEMRVVADRQTTTVQTSGRPMGYLYRAVQNGAIRRGRRFYDGINPRDGPRCNVDSPSFIR